MFTLNASMEMPIMNIVSKISLTMVTVHSLLLLVAALTVGQDEHPTSSPTGAVTTPTAPLPQSHYPHQGYAYPPVVQPVLTTPSHYGYPVPPQSGPYGSPMRPPAGPYGIPMGPPSGSYGSPIMGQQSGPYSSSVVSQGQQPPPIFPCPMGYPPVVPVSYDTQPPAYGDIYPQGIYDNVIDYCVYINAFMCHIYLLCMWDIL